ncbi:MAG: 2-oxoglutarate dehydrogenase complex dihydrolipoyllysine-residue succinyltransferase [Bacteroidetes bacterium]|jgi:2-oxoglutarate dehydrogenase E2 component (dihydrolipoamide succinyltransferase)|nr:2-oxoglutarate dehydrogenase complex dihydrolipoyllysine-residue succinyltransferase [Bacteroidota bacterium]
MSVVEMKVPTVGESVTEVTLSEWMVKEGDYVEMDQPICEFESDKATLEFPAEAAGVIEFVANEGDDLEIGDLVAKIDTSAEKSSTSESSEEDVSSESADSEVKENEADSSSGEKEENSGKDHPASGEPSPAAAKMMREHDLNSSNIKGTGKDGRIIKEDVQKAIEAKKQEKESSTSEEKQAPKQEQSQVEKEGKKVEKPEFASAQKSREERREKMSRMRRTIAKRLVSAKNETAMLTTFNEVDLTEIMAMRKKYQERFVEKNNIKLGFMSLFSKACAKVLMEMPNVNARLEDNELVYHDYVDISIAISTPNGLVVPPVHNVESMSLAEIEWSIKELAEKARKNELSLKEMQGGTFTITNGGIFGSMMSTPILNEPQSAILGMHTIQQRPMAIDGEVKIRPMMYLALSYDHRVVDGSTSVTFLVKVKKLLEDPMTLLLDL